MSAGAVAAGNALRALGRSLSPRSTAEAAGALAVVVFSGAFVAGEYAGLAFLVRLGRSAVAQLPALVPEILLERLLLGAFAGAGVLLLLGTLTTAVSTLFLSEELLLRMALPIPHARLLLRQVAATIALASGPAILVALPAVVLAAGSGAAGAAALAAAFLAVVVLAGAAGVAIALSAACRPMEPEWDQLLMLSSVRGSRA